ncbi:MAG TPA: hypothetical protein PKJ41_06030 [Bryobacteraceae bacterium]|nr:hypothetical protein [Bryobacteraceae bacterium]
MSPRKIIVAAPLNGEWRPTPDKASRPAKWDEHRQVLVPFRYLGANGTTVWSVRDATSIWIRCEGVGAPCAVSRPRPLFGAGVVGVGGGTNMGDSDLWLVEHFSLPVCAVSLVEKAQGGCAEP